MEELNFLDFEDDFIRDLDSWFTADIICCDNCYDDFVSNWPNIRLRSSDFFGVDLDAFYDGSKRVKENYTKEQYKSLLGQIKCPRCGTGLKYNIWPYEFTFDEPTNFEFRAYELQQLIKETPFIVLKHELANETYNKLEEIFTKQNSLVYNVPLFRGRIMSGESVNENDFLAPPKNVVNDGRYNHRGIPVIYSADQAITCYNELRRPDKNLWIAEFQIERPLKLLDLNNLQDNGNDVNLLEAIVWSSLASSQTDDENWYKPEYYFTRFISDCCKYLGYDGISYPSVQVGIGKNYVIFNTNLLLSETIIKYYQFEKPKNKFLNGIMQY